MMLLSKLVPESLRSLAGALKLEMYHCHRNLANSLCSLIRGYISHDVFCKVITKDQNIHHVWWLVELHSHLNACEFNV